MSSALNLGAGGLGDLDSDGCDDFCLNTSGEGRVEVYSGRTLSLMATLCVDPGVCIGFYGIQPAPLGDINGDQIPDFALSAFNVLLPAGFGGIGVINIISGADFSTIHQIHGRPVSFNADFLGSFLSGGHDVNGDGVADLAETATASNRLNNGAVISGRTGQMLYQVRSTNDGGTLDIGSGVQGASTIPDIDGDGYDDWTVGNAFYNVNNQFTGRIFILAGGPGDVEPVCDALPHSLGHPAKLSFYGAITEFGRGLEIRVDEAIPNSFAYIVFGPRSTPQPLGDGQDGQLCIDPQGLVRYGSPRPLDGAGMLRRDVDWGVPVIGQGPTAWTAGRSWTVQAIFRDGGGASGFNASNAIEVTVNQ